MKLIDLNLLLYAVNRDAPRHRKAKTWLQRILSANEPVALPWTVILGFVRITTHARILTNPLTTEQALSVVEGWLAQPPVCVLDPGPEHWQQLRGLLGDAGSAGNLTTDAHLAALAIENGCELCSADNDFARFPRLHWVNPLAG